MNRFDASQFFRTRGVFYLSSLASVLATAMALFLFFKAAGKAPGAGMALLGFLPFLIAALGASGFSFWRAVLRRDFSNRYERLSAVGLLLFALLPAGLFVYAMA